MGRTDADIEVVKSYIEQFDENWYEEKKYWYELDKDYNKDIAAIEYVHHYVTEYTENADIEHPVKKRLLFNEYCWDEKINSLQIADTKPDLEDFKDVVSQLKIYFEKRIAETSKLYFISDFSDELRKIIDHYKTKIIKSSKSADFKLHLGDLLERVERIIRKLYEPDLHIYEQTNNLLPTIDKKFCQKIANQKTFFKLPLEKYFLPSKKIEDRVDCTFFLMNLLSLEPDRRIKGEISITGEPKNKFYTFLKSLQEYFHIAVSTDIIEQEEWIILQSEPFRKSSFQKSRVNANIQKVDQIYKS